MSDLELEMLLYRPPVKPIDTPAVDWDEVRLELKKKGVTKVLLWEEYRERNPIALSYSQYCRQYDLWLKTQRISMRQEHKA